MTELAVLGGVLLALGIVLLAVNQARTRRVARERLDVAVFSSETGKRKPHPVIFEEALGRLGVDPARALFVGDRRYEDVRGAKEAGMTTVQAFWFRADDDERGLDPDFEAFTTMDVLNVVRRLSGEL